MEDRQTGADLVREGVQIEFYAELSVVALRGLLQPSLVGLEFVPARPRRAVEALQLIVLLITAPVRRRVPGEREGGDVPGVR